MSSTSRTAIWSVGARVALLISALCVIAFLVWQGIAAQGAPDPLGARTNPTVAALDIAVLVFREGLECILVLAAITASMTGHPADVVHRGRDHEPIDRKRTGSGSASGDGSSRGHCLACDYELVLSQNLLGRLDSRSQSKTKIADR